MHKMRKDAQRNGAMSPGSFQRPESYTQSMEAQWQAEVITKNASGNV
jgi:hypothetical protein